MNGDMEARCYTLPHAGYDLPARFRVVFAGKPNLGALHKVRYADDTWQRMTRNNPVNTVLSQATGQPEHRPETTVFVVSTNRPRLLVDTLRQYAIGELIPFDQPIAVSTAPAPIVLTLQRLP